MDFPILFKLDESTFIFRGIGGNFSFLIQFLMTIIYANRITPDGTPSSVASHLGLLCLPMSNQKDARLICIKKGSSLSLKDYFSGLDSIVVKHLLVTTANHARMVYACGRVVVAHQRSVVSPGSPVSKLFKILNRKCQFQLLDNHY